MRLHDGFALFMEQGVGKTIPALLRATELIEQGKAENALIVSPIYAMGAWNRDMKKIGFREGFSKITIINYERVWRKEEFNKKWDIIILDESHKIKSRTTKQASFLLKLALTAKYKYILTGTPVGNGKIEDLWSQLAFLYPVKAKKSVSSLLFGTYYEFLDNYCILNKYYKPYKYINVHEIQEIRDRYSIRVLKEECLDLPEKLPDEIYDIERGEKTLYNQLVKGNAIVSLDLVVENPLHKQTILRGMCSGFINLPDGKKELKCNKLATLKEVLDGWEKKMVIFCTYRYSIDQIEKLLKSLKIKYVTLDGRQKDKEIWRKFQSDESIQIIICQYQSGSMGIDLFASDVIIYYEPTLSTQLLEQSRDRIHRVGQTKKCSYIHFITKGTVEVAIYNALSQMMDFNEALFEKYIEQYQKGVKYK